MEATSFGIPVLATNVYGVKEIVNKNNGLLLPVEIDPEKIVKSINLILNSSFSRIKIKENWRENYFALENYSRFIEKYL